MKIARWKAIHKALHKAREEAVRKGDDNRIDWYNSQLALHSRKLEKR